MRLFGKEKVVIALGGGGARGLAHLGVLEVLEESDIPVAGIVGTSVGAIVGAAYALNPDALNLANNTLAYLRSGRFQNDHFRRMMFGADDVEQNFVQSVLSGLRKGLTFTNLIRRPSIFDGVKLREVIGEFVEDREFEDTQIPFAVPAIDLCQPLEVLLTSGSLRTAVVASCSLPGFFPPIALDDMLLADVGVIGSVPVEAAREFIPGALVIAVDLSTELAPIKSIERGWDSILRVENIAASKLLEIELRKADIVIRPDVGKKYWSDFSGLQKLVDCGRNATREQLDTIHSRLKGWIGFGRGRKKVVRRVTAPGAANER